MVHTIKTLPVKSTFNWSAIDIIEDNNDKEHDPYGYGFAESSGDEYEERQTTITNTPATRAVKIRKLMDAEIEAMESARQDTPSSSDDFDRLLLGSPNSSYIWIQYMAFYIDLSQLASARKVAERALQTMNASEIEEKRNVWLAYLNLEHALGDDNSLSLLLSRAVSYNDPEEIYLTFANMITQSSPARPQLAESTFQIMLKKFPHNSSMWRVYLSFLLDQLSIVQKSNSAYSVIVKNRKQYEDALARALGVLPAKSHVSLLSSLASKQFKMGEAHAARNVLEAILSKYPKQVDQWHVYIDLETNYGEINLARQLLEKATTSVKFSSKSMKDMAFETEHGTTETKEHVKQIAVDYLNSKET